MTIAYGVRQPCNDTHRRAGSEPCAKHTENWVLIVAVMGSSLAFIEGSIVNLALPSLQSDLLLDSVQLQWVVNAYMLTLASLIMIGGAAGDRYGLQRVYVVGLILFGGASTLCGVAQSGSSLVGLRAAQGLGAALVVPTSLAMLNVYFAAERRAWAIGIWAGASALTAAAGPILGGLLIDLFDWRAVFLVIPPIAAATAVLALRFVPERQASRPVPLDFTGALLLLICLAALTYALVVQGSLANVVLAGAISSLGFALFLRHETRSEHPMLPLSLFTSTEFSGANAMTVLLYFALGGALYFLPFNLVQVQGYSALQAGAAFLPLTLTLGFGSVLAGKQLKRYPARHLLTFGAVLTAIGLALLVAPSRDTSYWLDWFPGVALVGVGMTLCVSPLTTVVMGSVNDEHAGIASGINNTAARLAGLIAIAGLTSIATAVFEDRLNDIATTAELAQPTTAALIDRADELGGLLSAEQPMDASLRDAVGDGYVAVFRLIMSICSVLALAAAATAWLTLTRSRNQ